MALYDGFGRLRTSYPYTLFDATHVGLKNTLNFDFSGANIYDYSGSLVNLNSSDGNVSIGQSRDIFPYQPGKSLLVLTTQRMSDSNTSIERVGYFNHSHGIFFEKNMGTYFFVIRNGGEDVERVPQDQWNGRQLRNGLYILNANRSNIYWNDIEWLGVGDARCGFVIDGKTITCHTFHHANQILGTYMRSAVLPVRYEITEHGPVTKTLEQICCSVHSEGGYEIRSIPRTVGNNNIAIGETFISLISIRIKPGLIWDKIIALDDVNFYVSGNDGRGLHYKVVLGSTEPEGATWTDMPENVNSAVQYSVDSGFTGGREVYGDYVESRSTSSIPQNLEVTIGRNIDGSADVLSVVAVRAVSSQAVNASVHISWYEL